MNNNELELNNKIKALLLNKVEKLKWNYFDTDFDEAFPKGKIDEEEDKMMEFFEDIKSNIFGKCTYTGASGEPKDIFKVLFKIIDVNPQILPDIIRSLFKTNEIVNQSDAHEGILGELNKKNRELRDKIFRDKMRAGFRDKTGNIVILAEGDSWFQFPQVYIKDPVKDIIDWLMEEDNYAIKSLAAGADWLSNIFYSGEYIEELPKLSPDVLLISGGGNDLVGNNRLALMVNLRKEKNNLEEDFFKNLISIREKDNHIDIEKYKKGLKFISEEFFKFLNLYFLQYFVFLYNICNHPKYKKMLILTQGYDFVIPYNKNRGNMLSLQRLVNEVVDTGKWLFEPLSIKGITNKDEQEAIIYTLIFEFNEMMIKLAKFEEMKNVFHIDCRGVASKDDWFDELHLKSDSFKIVAKAYKACIQENLSNNNRTKKVYIAKDYK